MGDWFELQIIRAPQKQYVSYAEGQRPSSWILKSHSWE